MLAGSAVTATMFVAGLGIRSSLSEGEETAKLGVSAGASAPCGLLSWVSAAGWSAVVQGVHAASPFVVLTSEAAGSSAPFGTVSPSRMNICEAVQGSHGWCELGMVGVTQEG